MLHGSVIFTAVYDSLLFASRNLLVSDTTVCIDGFNLALPKGTGVATYGRTLAGALKALNCNVDILYGLNVSNTSPPALKEVQFFNELGAGNPVRYPKALSPRWWRQVAQWQKWGMDEIKISGQVELRGTESWLPAHDKVFNVTTLFERAHHYYKRTNRFATIHFPSPPKIMHWTYPLPIRVANSINIYTIHDLVPLRLPQTTLDNKKDYFRLIKKICKGNDPIVTVSQSSKKEIISFFPHAEERIYNTYQTIDREFLHPSLDTNAGTEEIKKIFGIVPDSYFLFFGSLEPKKNIGRLIEAFLMSSSNRKLVIVGAMAWKNESELRFMQRGIDLHRILYIDYLPGRLLVAMLRNARALLFPSIAEGFGLPVLEAFACGTPVMCSHEGGLAEVAADSALIVDAYDMRSIIAGINALDVRDDLCEELRLMGEIQAALFSEEKYAQRLQNAYDHIQHRS